MKTQCCEWNPFLAKASREITYLRLLVVDNKGKEICPPLALNCSTRISLLIFLMPLCFGIDHSHCNFGIHSIKMIFRSYNPLYHIITFFFFAQSSNCYLNGIMVIYVFPNLSLAPVQSVSTQLTRELWCTMARMIKSMNLDRGGEWHLYFINF